MTTPIVKTPSAISYTSDQIELIKNTIAVGATNDELSLFLQVCKNHKLDPLTRQIHFVKRAGKGTIQVSIDGFRTIAERTGAYAGNDDPVFDDEAKPKKATVNVWKMVNGVRYPLTATARWEQYYPGDSQGFMWKKMPHLMPGKCAEALALRKAFPEALSGLFSDEEMEQAGRPEIQMSETPQFTAEIEKPEVIVPEDLSKPATAEQVREIAALCKQLGGTVQSLYEKFRIKSRPSKKQAIDMIDAMRKKAGVPTADELAKALVVPDADVIKAK